MSEDAAKWLRRLKTHQCTIEALLGMPRPSDLLVEKLTALQELLPSMPKYFGETVFNEWNDKIAQWWKRYAQSTELNRIPCSIVRPMPKFDPVIKPNFPEINRTPIAPVRILPLPSPISKPEPMSPPTNFLISSEPFSVPAFKPISTDGQNDLSTDSNNSSHNSSTFGSNCPLDHSLLIRLSKGAVRLEMQHAFAQLDFTNCDNEFDMLKPLLAVVEKARTMTIPFWMDNRIQMDMFDLAFAKLPPKRQEQFMLMYDPGQRKRKSLRDLKRYLILQVSLSEEARAWIEHEFGSIPTSAECEDEMEMLKSLFRVLNKATGIVGLHFDIFTHEAIFDRAIGHLSVEKREMFWKSFEPKKSLRNLRKFIDDEIVFSYYMRNVCDSKDGDEQPQLQEASSKEVIVSQIKSEFDQFEPILHSSDIEGLKKLFELVCKIRAEASRFRTDSTLQSAIFDYAFSKLPVELQKSYAKQIPPDENKSMLELSKFLVMQIKLYYREASNTNNRWSYLAVVRPIMAASVSTQQKQLSQSPASPVMLILCRYCKLYGTHTADECPEKKSMVCFKCFKTGHKAVNCELFKSIRRKDTVYTNKLFGPCSICFICSQTDHQGRECPKAVCCKCNQEGHLSRNCSNIATCS